MGNPPGDHFVLTDFTLNQEATVMACPQGHAPVKVKHKKHKHIALFGLETCAELSPFKSLPGSTWEEGLCPSL